jgi:hypothetical protein
MRASTNLGTCILCLSSIRFQKGHSFLSFFRRAGCSREYGNDDSQVAKARTFFPLFPSHSSLKMRLSHNIQLAFTQLHRRKFGCGTSTSRYPISAHTSTILFSRSSGRLVFPRGPWYISCIEIWRGRGARPSVACPVSRKRRSCLFLCPSLGGRFLEQAARREEKG